MTHAFVGVLHQQNTAHTNLLLIKIYLVYSYIYSHRELFDLQA